MVCPRSSRPAPCDGHRRRALLRQRERRHRPAARAGPRAGGRAGRAQGRHRAAPEQRRELSRCLRGSRSRARGRRSGRRCARRPHAAAQQYVGAALLDCAGTAGQHNQALHGSPHGIGLP
ncbi:hypothetical protein J2T18_002293 [Paenibacillus polymyxa]|nr:hypothetical protein [Paenibacillus polymyxa]